MTWRWNLSLVSVVQVPILGDPVPDPDTGDAYRPVVGYEPGFRLDADNRLRCAEVEPYVVTPEHEVHDFGGPSVSFKLLFPEGEAQAIAVCKPLGPGWGQEVPDDAAL